MAKLRRFTCLTIFSFILVLCSIIPLRIELASYQAPRPQAILTLGGSSDREEFTAQLAKWYPSLEIWVSSGSPPDEVYKIFQTAGIPKSNLHLDYRATDTVTNFTTLVSDFKERQIQHLFLITSHNYLPRVKAIAFLVLGSQGITFTPLSVPSDQPKESRLRILRDIVRSLLWIVTGHTGASLKTDLGRY
ncbi:MAG: YdcF family protein [Aulosira sp. DedVER01a]|nr:YdcF family protein [Aulosira sp. ZfuVER01]